MLERRMKDGTEDECTVPWVLNNSNICSRPDDAVKAFWIGWNRITNQKEDCLIPCHTLQLFVSGRNSENSSSTDEAQVYLYFAPRIVKTEELYLYSFLSLIAEIGGYVGILLGYSFFQVAGRIRAGFREKIRKMEDRHRTEVERERWGRGFSGQPLCELAKQTKEGKEIFLIPTRLETSV